MSAADGTGPTTVTTGNVLGAAGAVPGPGPGEGAMGGRDSPMLGGVTGGVIPPGEIL
jgi:hypothetical protein